MRQFMSTLVRTPRRARMSPADDAMACVLRGRPARVKARARATGTLDVAMRWMHDDGLIFANSFNAAALRRASATTALDGARAIVRALRRAVRERNDGVAVDCASMEDLVAARDGGAADTGDDGFDVERVFLILSVEGADRTRAHVPLPLARVRPSMEVGVDRGTRARGDAAETARAAELEREMATMRAREARLLERCREEMAAMRAKHAAEVAAMRARETRLRVKLREAAATRAAVERTRVASETRALRAAAREESGKETNRRLELALPTTDVAKARATRSSDGLLDDIDERLKSLQTFLARAKGARPDDGVDVAR